MLTRCDVVEEFERYFGEVSLACREIPSPLGASYLARRVHLVVSRPLRIGRHGRQPGDVLCNLGVQVGGLYAATLEEWEALCCGSCVMRACEQIGSARIREVHQKRLPPKESFAEIRELQRTYWSFSDLLAEKSR